MSLGCKQHKELQKEILENKESSNSDSSFSQLEEKHDSLINLPGEINTITIPCDLDTAYYVDTKLGTVLITVKDNQVVSTTVVKERTLVVKNTKTTKSTTVNTAKDSIIVRTVIKEVPVTIKERYIPKFVLYSAAILWICTLVLLIRGIVKWYIRRKLKL